MLATALIKWVLLAVISVALLLILTYMYFTVGRRGKGPIWRQQPPAAHRPPDAEPTNTPGSPLVRRRRIRSSRPRPVRRRRESA